ncbi:hypothetical protein LES60_17610 [Pectobacterium brasiliense]|uniref:hypothetical protein n=1 Tax=Pectobacterium brasiliense TaxID=180957 RepID=UPI001CE213BD|nr:hypothetical protein [Pectobacterium brasiliense]MCA5918517.1 hypothetical protein [Pectobacterium brasiliense]MCA5928470.1 hypothetical protein [Pectobacterium brasiliense]MCA5934381.1 hypothetical protein [Pectobacterium brasiliense]MCA5939069.1 hypothetical protein [Pectobacterium brasiliense]MCA5942576.1 hypothetical protein [Pectobacterium brasiliense]
MTNYTDVTVKAQNAGPGLCFLLLLVVWAGVFFIPEAIFFVIPGMIGFALLFFIYYLVSEGHLAGILGGIVVSVILMGIAAAIPVIGWIILICWILYNIARAFESIQNLLPDAFLSAALYASLLIPVIYQLDHYDNSNTWLTIGCGIVYFFAAVGCTARISDRSDTSKHSLFLFSVMLLSVPMIVLLFASITASLRAAFQTSLVKTTATLPQSVSGYTTARGTVVADYTRNVTQTVVTSTIVPGAGAVGASLTGSLAELSTTADEQPVNRLNHEKEQRYATHKDHHFYRYDGLNDKKIGNFIQAVAAAGTLPILNKEDVLVYFDETLIGKGDRGVVLTDEAIYCLPGMFEDEEKFFTRFSNIEKVTFSGAFNKQITLWLKDGKKQKITLTQSNAGAKKIFEMIELAIA